MVVRYESVLFLSFALFTCFLVDKATATTTSVVHGGAEPRGHDDKAAAPTATTPSVAYRIEPRGARDGAVVGEVTWKEEEEVLPGRGASGDGPAAADHHDDGPGQHHQRPSGGAAAPQVLVGLAVPRPKLARRLLIGEGVGGGDSAAGKSCGSNSVHNRCTPPSPPH